MALTHTAELALPTAAAPGLRARLGAYIELTKPGIVRMVLITGGAGFFMASHGFLRFRPLLWTLLGMGLAAAGACALNEVVERARDARMRRTAGRPLPDGRQRVGEALAFAVALSVAGGGVLAGRVNATSALLGALTIVSYVGAYTPLKRVHWTATLVGAVPGALPILAGWAAAGGRLDGRGLALFGIMFAWQMPHFFALAWLYREDYRRGGFRMISERDATGHRTARQIVVWSLALVAISTLPSVTGMAGVPYAATALVLGLLFLLQALALLRAPTDARALRVFLSSVTYLPVLLLAMVLEQLLA
ncbi:MAG: protoheme IX farnesyltransferase [Gemmatimonadetes bacterium]|nr:protoheme IX farnesyltransferase [Gemmatimonadota bacterium]